MNTTYINNKKRIALSVAAIILLGCGWWQISGLTLLLAFVPIFMLSSSFDGSVKGCAKFTLWASLILVAWHLSTVWWVWNAAAIGTIAATVIGWWWAIIPLMLYHIVSKRMPKGIAYILFVTAWIGCEYIYLNAPALSFPWLTLGNGFAFDTWAVQWYEYTGTLGGSLWVLVSNILIYEALISRSKGKWALALCKVVCPIIVSLILFSQNAPTKERYTERKSVDVAVIQPNVDCYTKFDGNTLDQQLSLLNQLKSSPLQSDFILMPETALAESVNERFIAATRIVQLIISHLKLEKSEAMVITGSESIVPYGKVRKSDTNRRTRDGIYYDIFNSSIALTANNPIDIPVHHKGKLVVGVETLPAWFREGGLFGVDLGGTAGQLGIGDKTVPFTHNNIKIAPAICYEALYGHYMGGFVREGAQIFGVVSNDGWWKDTPGYRYLFAFCRLRAIEHRRDVVRSANTGISGFINSRGDVIDSLGWDKKGILSATIKANNEQTFYTRYGDYIGRLSLYIALLCLLYTVAILSKRRFYLD